MHFCILHGQTQLTLISGYGLTEAAPVTHLTPINRYLPGSTGPSIPNTYAKIVDLETGETIGPNEGTGELCIKGPQVRTVA